MPYAKNNIRVQVPKRSGFDKTHRHSGSSFVGTITPLMCDEVIPNSRVSLRIPINVTLPPLVSDTFMNIKYRIEAFFVPLRQLSKSFENWFCDIPIEVEDGSKFPAFIPYVKFGKGAPIGENGSLADYLGCKINTQNFGNDVSIGVNAMPFLAYHWTYHHWYRNPMIQKPVFVSPAHGITDYNIDDNPAGLSASVCPYFFSHAESSAGNSDEGCIIVYNSNNTVNEGDVLNDGVSLLSLRQRNFGLDYFTGMRLSPQHGDASAVNVYVSGTASEGVVSGTGSMTIAALRAANSLQQFKERNNLPSTRMVDQVQARYGANLSDGVAQRPICIGTAAFDVYSHGVDQTGGSSSTDTAAKNPFSGVAAQYGRAAGNANEFVINDFTANEPGYILVLGTLVPDVTYSSGMDRKFRRYLSNGSLVEMPCSLLQNVGDQPVYASELTEDIIDQYNHLTSKIVGYQDRFADFMFMRNEVSGILRDGGTLDSFVLQRSFDDPDTDITLSSEFLSIPTNYLDQVLVANSNVIGCSYWFDCMLEYKVSMPLAEFSIPSLQDPAYEHGESITLRRNGQIF